MPTKTITTYDEKKYFIVDDDITRVVQLIKAHGNGTGKIKNIDNISETINLTRLTFYEEKQKIADLSGLVEEVQFKIRNVDGTLVVKVLKEEEAEKWQKMMVAVCVFADSHDLNPDWLSLKGEIEIQ